MCRKTKLFNTYLTAIAITQSFATLSAWAGPEEFLLSDDCNVRYAQMLRLQAAEDPKWGGANLSKEFAAGLKEELLHKFSRDGRPILFVTDGSVKHQKSGVVTFMKVFPKQIEKLTDGKVKMVMLTPDDVQFDGKRIVARQVNDKLGDLSQDLVIAKMKPNDFSSILKEVNPQAVHIAVEGPLGRVARQFCLDNGIPFTTAYHTMFPEFLRDQVAKVFPPLAEPVRKIVDKDLKAFHLPSQGVMVPTESMTKALVESGYDPKLLRVWSHGVDIEHFHPSKADPKLFEGLERPISLFAGRVAPEKNIEDFLQMNIPGTKVIVGAGPSLDQLKAKYAGKNVVFLGSTTYEMIPKYFASSDVFVFPSLTDTFGLVQLESMASGVPVVAYKVQGPIDVVTSQKVGSLADHVASDHEGNLKRLTESWHQATTLKKEDARQFAEENSWDQSVLQFLYYLRQVPKGMFANGGVAPLKRGLSNKTKAGLITGGAAAGGAAAQYGIEKHKERASEKSE